MIKIATIEDAPEILNMVLKFAENSNYFQIVSKDKIEELINNILNSTREQAIILLEEGKGMLAAMIAEFPYGNILQATELAWWVEPEYRNTKVGQSLIEAFEFWADKVGAKIKVMSCLDDTVSKFYEKNGYKLYERIYFKEI